MGKFIGSVFTDKGIPTPCVMEVNKYLSEWNVLESYSAQENSLEKLFVHTYPRNNSIEEILAKTAVLNDFYSTNIFNTYRVAKHIFELDIDNRLQNGDMELVNDIALVDMGEGKIKNFYSFATKFCSHHKPLDYPIYDSFVDEVLRYFRNKDNFYVFLNKDLKNYKNFKNILIEFQRFYALTDFNIKDIDKYLWQFGKKYFRKKY